MTDMELALLNSLALRPSPAVPLNVLPIVIALRDAGYVVRSASGWMATELGCVTLEMKRTTARR